MRYIISPKKIMVLSQHSRYSIFKKHLFSYGNFPHKTPTLRPCPAQGTVLKPNESTQHRLPQSQRIRFQPIKSNFFHQRIGNQYHTNNKQWCDWWPKSLLDLGRLVVVCLGAYFLVLSEFCWGKKKVLLVLVVLLAGFVNFWRKKLVLFGFTVVKMVDEKWMKASPLWCCWCFVFFFLGGGVLWCGGGVVLKMYVLLSVYIW